MSIHPPHVEQRFTGSATVRDVVIDMSDGLTVWFARVAGLAGAVRDHGLIIVVGASELAACSIAMGLGGYFAARSDADAYRTELARERREIVDLPERETDEVREQASAASEPPTRQTAVWLMDDEVDWLDSRCQEIKRGGWRNVTRSHAAAPRIA